jgi:pyruvate/2-oxoglutarate/acetoin dehydrogenase E1 component
MKMNYREALKEGLKNALDNDSRVFMIGEDIGAYGGTYAVTKDLLNTYGAQRIMDAPLSENGFTGIGIGAAIGGLRPIVEIMTVNFGLLALDQIVNSAAIYRHMSGGQISVPIVIRMTTGGGRQLAAQHSNSLEGWFAHIPGIKILAPATVEDARGFLHFALHDNDPVLIFEHALLLNHFEEVSERPQLLNPYKALVRKKGENLTLITYGGMLKRCMQAADEIEGVEVIDLRSLRPLDDETIFTSVRKTHRALIVDEDWKSGSLSAEISARIMESCFYDLDAPVERLCRREIPIPYARHLEEAAIPQKDDIAQKIRELLP